MMKIFKKIEDGEFVGRFLKRDGRFIIDDPLTFSLVVASVFRRNPQKILINCPNLYEAQEIYEHLIHFSGEENLLFFPQDEIYRIDIRAYSKEMLSQRLFVMNESLKKEPKILICHSASLSRFLPESSLFRKNTFELYPGKAIGIDEIAETLSGNGYQRVNKIDGALQYAKRGDILDIYPIHLNKPVRIEFLYDEIESIRSFDIATQLSDGAVERVVIPPASDLILSPEERKKIRPALSEEVEKYRKELSPEAYQSLKSIVERDLDFFESEGIGETFYKYLYLVLEQKVSIADYFQPDFTICYDFERCISSSELLLEQTYAYFSECFKIGKSFKNYCFFDDFRLILERCSYLVETHSMRSGSDDVEIKIRAVPEIAPNLFQATENIRDYLNRGYQVAVCLSAQYDVFKEYLQSASLDYAESGTEEELGAPLTLLKFDLPEGFDLYEDKQVFLSKKEIYGYRMKVSRFLSRYKKAQILQSYDELEKGDYVVHEECGIGRFEEIVNLETMGVRKDFLKIRYAGDDVLYVPLEQFHLIRKYVSKEGAVPKLNRINGGDWARTKKRIKDKVNDLADRLIRLYAERNSTVGFACREDDEFQRAFERAFPYPLTEDQERAIEEIKRDMESPHPMDRLLCGDVGFGKTEVAFRAAFKAILNGGQVALLCPTTLLSRQHFQVAQERFALFGVKIAQFSRFIPQSVQKKQIEEIKEGKIHLIIGTHRLLSKDIVIPHLRLLIVDEEQRFGVEHKERIKEVSQNIDVLTLSATPIPRTLQMSLLGIRSLSQLQSPPMNRMPIQTYVMPKDDDLIKEAIERELARKGQVYYLHNQIYSMNAIRLKIEKRIRNVRVDIVHGKMDKDEIEEVMSRFYQGEIDVLICTSIIETGLDIANVNTIIIENADHFGLAQLYQIKGRVGRSNKIAYAYLLFNDQKEMNEVARKRLKAIRDFTELGSGFKIAQRDLTIRGAGDILGAEQAGFIDTVGIDMYLKLLNEAIQEKQGIQEETNPVRVSNLVLDAYIPKTYASNADKLEIYRQIQKISTVSDLDRFRDRLRDIYGKIPPEVLLLLKKRTIDILSSAKYFESMEEEGDFVVLRLTKEASAMRQIGLVLFSKLSSFDHLITGFSDRQIKIKLKKTGNDYLDRLQKLLTLIVDTCDSVSNRF